jgi:hypothetical protein
MANRYWRLAALFFGFFIHATGVFFAAGAPIIPNKAAGQTWLVFDIGKHADGFFHYVTFATSAALWFLQITGAVIAIWSLVSLQREIKQTTNQ